jgi:hypothetical protein
MTAEDIVQARLTDLITKGEAVLRTRRSAPKGYVGFPDTVDYGEFNGWKAQSRVFLTGLLGEAHAYVTSFESNVQKSFPDHAKAGVEMLRNVSEDFARGYLKTLRALISAEVFQDFLEMADHLLASSYKDPAAMLAGAVLEDGLKRVATSRGITVRERDDLSSLNARCADSAIYNRLKQKQVQTWIALRNHADHAEFTSYSAEDVEQMLSGVRTFLTDYLI